MFGQTYTPRQFRPADDWQRRVGEIVQIRNGDAIVRQGRVEDEMPDGSGVWLAANGTDQRAYFHKETGTELWIQLAHHE